ncbi:MAG: zinc-binding dehydrogenase [Candidatus Dormibacteria bacterium]
MTGAVLPGDRKVEVREYEVPEPGPGQVLVAMRASGLCGSDLRAIYRPTQQGHGPEAYRGVIAGHEPAGQIAALGPGVTDWLVGDRVLLYHIAGCGECEDCRSGWMISCTSPARAAYGWQRDGGHADFILAEVRTLVRLDEPLSYVDGALVACGFGTAYAGCLRGGVGEGQTVVISGMGPVGLGAAMIARAIGARVLAVEASPARLEMARAAGADEVVAAGQAAEEAIRDLTGGRGADVSIDCSAAEAARRLTLAVTRRWGTVVWLGEGGTFTFEPSPLLIHQQLSLLGSWVCSIQQMTELVGRLVEWQVRPETIVTHRFLLDQVAEAYRRFDTGDTGKVVLTWPG